MSETLWIKMANLVFELDKKLDPTSPLDRTRNKMKLVLEEANIYIYNPIGEKYAETRTDLEANISGTSTNDLYITDVVKPVIYTNNIGKKELLQKGIVIVSGK
jgi:hypothetical protein